jgi:hypothetical protein
VELLREEALLDAACDVDLAADPFGLAIPASPPSAGCSPGDPVCEATEPSLPSEIEQGLLFWGRA